MERLTEKQKGEVYIFFTNILWAFFPILVVLSYAAMPAFSSLAWSTLFATIFFACIVVYKKRWREFADPLLWKYTLLGTFFIGILYYAFYYAGLLYTTPGNVALIALFETFTTFLFFNVLRGEHISAPHKVGAALMVLGAVIVLAPNFAGFNIGDILILVATFFTPAGNLFQQKARLIASSESMLFIRSAIATVFFFIVAYALREHATLQNVGAAVLFLLVNGVVLFGLSKILFIEGIHRIPVTKAIALGCASPVLTLLVAWALLGQVPTLWQLASLAPLVLGVLLLTDQLWSGKPRATL